jgi:hypothetical protein
MTPAALRRTVGGGVVAAGVVEAGGESVALVARKRSRVREASRNIK